MSDQANDLRRLMIERALPNAERSAVRRRWIVVAGGKGGVGTTTVALYLALADTKKRTLLVDADPRGGDIALRCGLDDRRTIGDLLAGGRPLADVIQEGPSGLRCVPGVRGWDASNNGSWASADRLFAAFNENDKDHNGDGDIDAVILDIGNAPNRATCRLWDAADAALLVTDTEAAGIVGAFDAMKQFVHAGGATPSLVLVNRASTPDLAEDVFGRLAHASRRFLGLSLTSAGHFPAVGPSEIRENGSGSRSTLWLPLDAGIAFHACMSAVRRSNAAGQSYPEYKTKETRSYRDVVCGT